MAGALFGKIYTRSAPTPAAPYNGTRHGSVGWVDLRWGGHGQIQDQVTVEVNGVPTGAARRVHLIDRRTLLPVRSTWSASDGSYGFSHLRIDVEFVVLAFDLTREYNAVVLDGVMAAEPDE